MPSASAGTATRRKRLTHPDIWPGMLISDLDGLEAKLATRREMTPGGPDRYSYRDLRRFADLIRDRLKQYGTVDTVDQIGLQDEVVDLFYSGRRFSAGHLAARRCPAARGPVTSICPAARSRPRIKR